MWALLEFLAGLLEICLYWRALLSVLLSMAVIGIIYWLVPDRDLCMILSIPVGLVGIWRGIVWEWGRRG